ncbi:MAG TPA: serine hydrolase [Parafilimonas sp.]|nr:serine hydrolase [Parafilimonas sp.]
MKKLFLLVFSVLLITCLHAQPPFLKDSIDDYINKGLKDWNIPGLAIVIVKDGQVVLMKGYGVRNLETKEPVDENTLFMIASNTKLFTATSLAQLEYDKKLSLDDKITKYFPWYADYDTCTTKLVTVKDMLSHHLGTKTFQGDFTFWNSTLSRDSIMYKMRLLKPTGNFRQQYGYCNSCFLTAGQVIEKVTGKPWEVYVYDSIVEPLGMTNTHTLGNNMGEMPDAATPYTNTFSNDLQALPYDNVDNLAPAGAIVSCVKDLSKWLMLQLDSGKADGKQIIPWPAIRRTRDMSTIINSRKNPFLPINFYGYGLGIFISDYGGHLTYEHTGGADGFVTNTCFVPDENLGISILTNNDNQEFFELLRYQILDAFLGLPRRDYSALLLPRFMQNRKESLDKIDAMKARVKNSAPPFSINSYVGTYANELFGNIAITSMGNDLLIKFGNHKDLNAKLQYMDSGEWLMTYNNPAFGIFPLRFTTDDNKVTAVTIKVNDFLEYDPYVFTKQ